MQKLYYAHPVTSYNTWEEFQTLTALANEYDVVNPNQKHHALAYEKLKKETGDGMQYFVDLCTTCDTCAFATFPNGNVGSGVATEVQSFLARNAPVFHVTAQDNGRMSRIELLPVTSLEGFTVLNREQTLALITEIRSEKGKAL